MGIATSGGSPTSSGLCGVDALATTGALAGAATTPLGVGAPSGAGAFVG